MKKVYINGLGSISAQKTFDNTEFLSEITSYEIDVLPVIDPDYKNFIPPAAARRMAKGIKMGVVASKIALDEAQLENVDAIITGTGLGCAVDSEKFVSALIDNQEAYLTPTSFIQSTHNTVGGQIALGLGCQGYNFTYVHGSISFESALLDAKLQLENGEATTILIGGVDETGEHTIKIHKLIGHIKKEPVKSSKLLASKTEGAIFGEGANFFVLSNQKNEASYAEVVALNTFNTMPRESLEASASEFLQEVNLCIQDVDVLILGNNGDVSYDAYYDTLSKGSFKNTPQLCYKHLSGEFYTASSFGFWLGCKILKEQSVPKVVQLNDLQASNLGTILLYNQYRGENHSFTLLKKC
jgi:3-oxoacyl-(acyl-carrier-protein) synthase